MSYDMICYVNIVITITQKNYFEKQKGPNPVLVLVTACLRSQKTTKPT